MEITVFEGLNKNELSMIEVAHAILEQHGDVMDFSDLANEIQNYLGKSDAEIRDSLAQFYTDLNIDGSFISLGDNRWGLRSWYAIDSIDEEVNHGLEDEDDEDTPRRRKRKRVNAFITDDEDAIDYNDDDPEDADLDSEDEDDDLFDDEEDEDQEIAAYNADLQEIGADSDDEEEVPDSIEEDLTILDDDDVEDDDEDDDYDDPDLVEE